jgi:hypothetical protein
MPAVALKGSDPDYLGVLSVSGSKEKAGKEEESDVRCLDGREEGPEKRSCCKFYRSPIFICCL